MQNEIAAMHILEFAGVFNRSSTFENAPSLPSNPRQILPWSSIEADQVPFLLDWSRAKDINESSGRSVSLDKSFSSHRLIRVKVLVGWNESSLSPRGVNNVEVNEEETKSSLKRASSSHPVFSKDDIHIFFILTPTKAIMKSGNTVRIQNVRNASILDANVKAFTGLHWENWDLIKKVFSVLKLPNAHMPEVKGTRNRKGKYARWASIIFSLAYAVQYRLPHIVILEDDSKWPGDLRQRLLPYLRYDDKFIKLSKWGEGYLLSLPCAVNFIMKVYDVGINRHSDTWIRDTLNQITLPRGKIPYELLVGPNDGDIYNSDKVVNKKDFPYKASYGDPSPLLTRLGFIRDANNQFVLNSSNTCYNSSIPMVNGTLKECFFISRADLKFAKVASRLVRQNELV